MSKVASTRFRWVAIAEGEVCVGEALGEDGQVLAQTTIGLKWADGDDFKSAHGKMGLSRIEKDAQEIAAAFVENPPPA